MISAPLFREIEKNTKKEEIRTVEAKEIPKEAPVEISEKPIRKISEPVAKKLVTSEFSITAALNKKEEISAEIIVKKEEDLPDHHFTDKDLKTEWQNFLHDLLIKDEVIYYAVNTIKLHKKDENLIQILYPSDFVKAEFDKIQSEFFNHFKRKVNNYKIELEFTNDVSLKKEILTKRKIFEKFVEINPVLKDLDDLMKFDLT